MVNLIFINMTYIRNNIQHYSGVGVFGHKTEKQDDTRKISW